LRGQGFRSGFLQTDFIPEICKVVQMAALMTIKP
jgi:hypothetical protein